MESLTLNSFSDRYTYKKKQIIYWNGHDFHFHLKKMDPIFLNIDTKCEQLKYLIIC